MELVVVSVLVITQSETLYFLAKLTYVVLGSASKLIKIFLVVTVFLGVLILRLLEGALHMGCFNICIEPSIIILTPKP